MREITNEARRASIIEGITLKNLQEMIVQNNPDLSFERAQMMGETIVEMALSSKFSPAETIIGLSTALTYLVHKSSKIVEHRIKTNEQ